MESPTKAIGECRSYLFNAGLQKREKCRTASNEPKTGNRLKPDLNQVRNAPVAQIARIGAEMW